MDKVFPKILIVENEFIIQRYIEDVLTVNGYQVVGTAISGEQALEKTARLNPDVLLDIGVNGKIDGMEIAKQLVDKYGIKVVFLTGNTDQATWSRALEVNPLGILKKPIGGERLALEFGNLLSGHTDIKFR